MPILQTFTCDIPGCVASQTEQIAGDGALGWGQVKGIVFNGVADPLLCPRHLAKAAEFMDTEAMK